MVTSQYTFPTRAGPKPRTTQVNPHEQLDQNAPPAMQELLIEHVLALPRVKGGDSVISRGSRAFILDPAAAGSDSRAFFGTSTEFAHVHPPRDGSLHANLPPTIGANAVAAGWAEAHPMAARAGPPIVNFMLYGPRNEEELTVIESLVEASYRFAIEK